MPTYHYKCKACSHEFEEFQSMSDDPLVKCPSCGKKKLVRLITGAGLVFKGSGFYLTDYKKRNTSASESPKEKPAPGEKTSGTPATPEKTAEKPAEKKNAGPAAPPSSGTA
jgi:putative FmdB family regulatory protein